MARAFWLLLFCCGVGCGEDVCAQFSGGCLALEVRSAPGEALSVDQLGMRGLEGFDLPGGNDALTPSTPRRSAAMLPVLVALVPPADFAGAFQVEVRGLLDGEILRLGYATGSVGPGQHLHVEVVLDHNPDGSTSSPPDLAHAPGRVDLARQPSGVDLAQASSPCDPVLQSGCGGGQRCTIAGGQSSGNPVCITNGDLTVGAGCDPDNDHCIAGALCLADATGGFDKECRRFCDHDNGDDDCPRPAALDASSAEQSHCLQLTDDSSLGLCTTPCNPVTAAGPTGCPSASKCFFNPFVNADILGLTDCTTIAGSKLDGELCSTEQECAPGFYCRTITQGGAPVCRQMCRIGLDSDCSQAGYKCIQDIVSLGGCCPGGTC